ncbi:hypothetical protein PINS_up004718 [Pythium insidiosum]|nr:hypothetical protein PINS_up004718 [Pythium insidiosum]
MIDHPLPLPVNAFRDALEALRRSCRELHDHATQLSDSAPGLPRDVDVRRQVDEIVALTTSLQSLLQQKPSIKTSNGHASTAVATTTTTTSTAAVTASKELQRASSKRFDELEPTPAHGSADHWAASPSSPALSPSQPSVWSGFYNKTLRERFDVLSLMYPRLQRLKGDALPSSSSVLAPSAASPSSSATSSSSSSSSELSHPFTKLGELPVRTANLMIENCIGVLGIPLGYVLVVPFSPWTPLTLTLAHSTVLDSISSSMARTTRCRWPSRSRRSSPRPRALPSSWRRQAAASSPRRRATS